MSDLIRRSQEAKRLLADVSLREAERLFQALEAFSGLVLTGIPEGTREPFEAGLARVSHILSQYSLENDEDYERIGADDMRQMFETVDATASQAIAAELDRIVAELDAGFSKLPRDVVGEVREHRALMIPRLIQLVRDAAAAARNGEKVKGDAHFFAFYLLTEFRVKEALPEILETVSLPGEAPFDLFGDAIHEVLGRAVAIMSDDPVSVLEGLIRNRRINEYVRWNAAHGYLFLVRDGIVRREEAVDRLRQHLRNAIDGEDFEMTGPLIIQLKDLGAAEAKAEIDEAFSRDLVDGFLIDPDSTDHAIAGGEGHCQERLARLRPTALDDTIAELKTWAVFEEKKPSSPRPKPWTLPPPPPRRSHEIAAHRADALLQETATPVEPRGPRVGRNEPCPCGSGKKYKRCCGSKK